MLYIEICVTFESTYDVGNYTMQTLPLDRYVFSEVIYCIKESL